MYVVSVIKPAILFTIDILTILWRALPNANIKHTGNLKKIKVHTFYVI